jgi:hypothetical protein
MKMNFAFAAEHPFMFAIGAMAVMCSLFAADSINHNSSIVVLLLGLTFFYWVNVRLNFTYLEQIMAVKSLA